MPVCDQCLGSGWQGVLGHFDKDRVPCTKCNGSGTIDSRRQGEPRPGGSSLGGAFGLLVIAGLAYLGYRFGIETSNMPGSSRGTFFAIAGGYLGLLLMIWRSSGIIGAAMIAGLIEFIGRFVLKLSPHAYILEAF